MNVRRWSGAAAVLVLGAGLGLQPGGADAAAGTAQAVLAGAAKVQVAAAGCAVDYTNQTPQLGLPVNGGWRSVTGRGSGRLGDFRVAADSTSRGRLAQDARGNTRVDLAVDATSRLAPTGADTKCWARYGLGGRTDGKVSITARSWLVVRSTVAVRGGTAGGAVDLYSDDRSVIEQALPNEAVTRLVAPRSYTVTSSLFPVAASAAPTATQVATLEGSASVSFIPIGTRRTLTGNGTGYIKVGHRDCGYDRAKAYFSSAARTKVRSVTFFVNGQRRQVLTGSQLQRSALMLTSIAKTSGGAIRADIVLKTGERRTTSSTSWPCA